MLIVAVCSVGLSFADNLFLHGRYQVKKLCPIVPGLEGGGIVTAVARNVIELRIGNKIGFNSLMNGSCAEEVLFPEFECGKLPD